MRKTSNEKAVIKHNYIEEVVKVTKGVRTGYSLSSFLFDAYIQEPINKVTEGIIIQGERMNVIGFADDIAITAETEHDLKKY